MACISSSQAIHQAAALIASGQADAIVAGGVETMSDVPIRYPKKMRQRLIEASRYKGLKDLPKFFKGMGPSWFVPEAPAIAEFSTGACASPTPCPSAPPLPPDHSLLLPRRGDGALF